MSSRYLKSLKLNGVIVGEHLGSDDQDEDVEAARDMLRAKGLYSPPSLPAPCSGRPIPSRTLPTPPTWT
jgi:hypothetical protein